MSPLQQPHSNIKTKLSIDRYTKSGSSNIANRVVYAIVLNWPKNERLKLAAPQLVPESTVTLLGYSPDLQVQNEQIILQMSSLCNNINFLSTVPIL